MTALTLARALRRRWYLTLLGLLATLAVAIGVPARAQPVYYTQTDVAFLPPGGELGDVSARRDDLVAFAAAVERQVNQGRPVERLSSASAPLYGAGIRQGWSVVVPNLGNQWANSFSRPVLSVEVVDADPQRVRQVRAQLLERIRRASQFLQDQAAVAPAARITVQASPQAPAVETVGASTAGKVRAFLVIGLLGGGGTLAATAAADRRLVNRRRPAEANGVQANGAQAGGTQAAGTQVGGIPAAT